MSEFNNDIAIIGMACHYPGAPDINAFWQNLKDGVESISRFSDEELLVAGVDPAELADPNYVPAYGWLDGIDQFDAPFFGLTPREAQLLDPQQRLFLMCAWHALEDAAVDPEREKRPIAVFAGAGKPVYYHENILTNPELLSEMGAFQTTLSNDKDFLATRVSYKLNLKGPSLTVQTACSTSLVAIHLAIQSLLNGECDLALAGGASIVTTGKSGYLYTNDGLFDQDGHCRAFDADAGGMVGGDGVGAVILKRMEDAEVEGDTIYAVIKGSAVNNDGAAKIGYTAPSIEGQAAAILEAQSVADVHPDSITLIEAHGTGTPLGDPIEVAALTAAFQTQTARKGYCAIGSVKTNIGHTNAAAGVAGVIKTALALFHQQIPPSLNFKTPNPEVDFDNSPFYVNTISQPWANSSMPRRAGVSSFGMGGTNAHAILEEAPPQNSSDPARRNQLLALSAKTETALEKQTADLAHFLAANPTLNLADVAHTLQIGRQRFRFRRTAVVQSTTEAIERLQNPTKTGVSTTNNAAVDPPLAFMFPGVGSQYVYMGRDLYETESVFRDSLDLCARFLETELEHSLLDYLYPPPTLEAAMTEALKRPSICMPAIFAVSYATAQLWLSWGVRPTSLSGHSLGEYGAALLAGVFQLEDALKIVVKRGQLTEQIEAGALLGVSLTETAVNAYLQRLQKHRSLSIAAINAPEQSVVTGTIKAISDLEALLDEDEIPYRRLAVSAALHSVMIEPFLGEFAAFVGQFSLSAPAIPLISNVSGNWMTAEEATDPNYWAKHLRQPVRFADGAQRMLADPKQVFLEVGPGQVITTLTRQNPGAAGRTLINSLRHPKQDEADDTFLLKTLGRLWQAGVTVDWPAFYKAEQRLRLSLPTYPFDKKRYWTKPEKQTPNLPNKHLAKKNPNPAEWLYAPSWQRTPALLKPPIQSVDFPEASLIFKDSHGLGTKLAGVLQQAGRTTISVNPGRQFEVIDRHNISLNPGRPKDFAALIDHLKREQLVPTTIFHLWQWGPVEDFKEVDLDQSLDLGFFTLLYLAQALETEGITNPIKLAVITSGMQEVTGTEPLAPERAAVIGPIKVIPAEYGHINAISIDAPYPPSAELPSQLASEGIAPSASHTDTVIAYRGRFRWQQTFTKVSPLTLTQPARLKKQGVYLITGGLGGIGLALADYLAQTVQAHLVLVGRSGLPPRSEWNNVIDSGMREQMSAVLDLEDKGAEVIVAAADITDLAAMMAVFEHAQARFGQINGIIHSAGLPGGGAIALKEPEEAKRVLAAKLRGTQVLHSLCPVDIDFVVLNSSAGSILGGYGQVDYTAANAVLDAYAPYLNRNGRKCTSIYWDVWKDAGISIKTAADLPPELRRQREDSLRLGLETAEGQQVFQKVLEGDLSQVVVSTYDFNNRYQSLINVAQTAELETTTLETSDSQSNASATARPTLDTTYLAPRNETEFTIATRWQLLFGIDQIGVEDDFFALGGHSLLATQLLNRLRKDFPTASLSLQDLFSSPTIAGIANLVERQIKQQTTTKTESTSNPTTDQLAFMTTYLQEHLADSLGKSSIGENDDLLPLGLEKQIADIIWRLRRDLSLIIYPQELLANPTLTMLAEHTAQALTHQQSWMKADGNPTAVDLPPHTTHYHTDESIQPGEKNPPMVFLLSAPRSGSTLLRLMLAGHPALFAPPELALLAYNLLTDWQAHQQTFFTETGLEQALAVLLNLDEADIEGYLNELARKERPIQATYRLLQKTAEPRILVDKTPGYAQHSTVLNRAETIFERPKYIHLIRHPYAVIESFVRYRLHIVLGQPTADPAKLGERVWQVSQQNILELGQQVGPDRYKQIYFEELATNPAEVMEQVCDFLEIPFDERLLHPYSGERMISGPGDPDILQHDSIDPEPAHIWRKIQLPSPLTPEAQSLAASLGYELPNETAVNKKEKVEPGHLADLSDDEVDALLQQLMED